MTIEQRLVDLGLSLPDAIRLRPGVDIPFQWVRVRGNRAFVSGHGALTPDGTPGGPFGRVPTGVSLAAAQESARSAMLAILSSLREVLGSLDRISAWLTVSGFVNAEPGYRETPRVMNPCSELIIDLFGPDVGAHARTAIGVAALPLDLPVIIAAEVELLAAI